ncbi:hypothetical protein BKA82DRAFT_32636 [Pisolithus tinctorius]|uniref:Uncharacterized protein n=1 Tax=Pisolithus tinctorius Marx 270 TaxID=870435 RepID=A0A0C3JHF0_PISTI|nr:hypothetical protein BKA82DRAFT_32636 [Pisolithus tinctorius]KIN97036.1 hypothetical protein M404DRAFT_32636 [Pisolithus tinctorius Marx 270]
MDNQGILSYPTSSNGLGHGISWEVYEHSLHQSDLRFSDQSNAHHHAYERGRVYTGHQFYAFALIAIILNPPCLSLGILFQGAKLARTAHYSEADRRASNELEAQARMMRESAWFFESTALQQQMTVLKICVSKL